MLNYAFMSKAMQKTRQVRKKNTNECITLKGDAVHGHENKLFHEYLILLFWI